jgi:hypothetical protein
MPAPTKGNAEGLEIGNPVATQVAAETVGDAPPGTYVCKVCGSLRPLGDVDEGRVCPNCGMD